MIAREKQIKVGWGYWQEIDQAPKAKDIFPSMRANPNPYYILEWENYGEEDLYGEEESGIARAYCRNTFEHYRQNASQNQPEKDYIKTPSGLCGIAENNQEQALFQRYIFPVVRRNGFFCGHGLRYAISTVEQ